MPTTSIEKSEKLSSLLARTVGRVTAGMNATLTVRRTKRHRLHPEIDN
jgi:hypothetical protein